MEISVLDRQKAVLMQRLYQNQTTTPHHHHVWPNQDMIIDHYNNNNVMMHSRFPVFDDHHHRSNNNCNNSPTTTTRVEMSNHHCSNSSSFVSRDNYSNNNVNCSIKKRKAEYDVQKQEEQEEADESQSQSQSAITTKNNNEKANSSEKSKVSDVQQKPDYIHVRARRGQATDSHSLAERARREKISKKMKCLQDLVPGCNRATGKAGMLDEIINYVQSLQKQVEFLSMKLAVLNPRLDFSVDDFFAKEMPAYIASLQTATQYEAADPTTSFAHNNLTSNHGFDIAMNQPQKVSPSSLASSMQIPEAFLDPSFIHQLQQMSGLESEFPNLYNMGLH